MKKRTRPQPTHDDVEVYLICEAERMVAFMEGAAERGPAAHVKPYGQAVRIALGALLRMTNVRRGRET